MNHPATISPRRQSSLPSDLAILNHSRRPSSLSILLAVLYSILLNLSLPPESHPRLGLPSLPLRHSSLITLLPHLIFESILIARLSHSSSTSLGACLHLLKIPLLSTTYRYFKLDLNTQIARSLAFDFINYLGQFLLFYSLSSSPSTPQTYPTLNVTATRTISTPISSGSTTSIDGREDPSNDFEQISPLTEDERIELDSIMKNIRRDQDHSSTRRDRKRHAIFMSILTWTLISLVDGSLNFVLERTLSPKIRADVHAFTRKLELDRFFLLKSSDTFRPTEVLRSIDSEDRTMIDHQLISPLINLPYLFSSASLISLPSDFILLDRLPMLSINTKLQWLFGLMLRRFLNFGLAYFFKT